MSQGIGCLKKRQLSLSTDAYKYSGRILVSSANDSEQLFIERRPGFKQEIGDVKTIRQNGLSVKIIYPFQILIQLRILELFARIFLPGLLTRKAFIVCVLYSFDSQ